jgi:hypothetical protein
VEVESLAGVIDGLNRTSVGLKPLSNSNWAADRPAPQSNQRGIETIVGAQIVSHRCVPQSNQRGIETDPDPPLPHHLHPRLNRTSVGLKLTTQTQSNLILFLPQSNRRGIETMLERRDGAPPAGRLNRTSVRLKPSWIKAGKRARRNAPRTEGEDRKRRRMPEPLIRRAPRPGSAPGERRPNPPLRYHTNDSGRAQGSGSPSSSGASGRRRAG